jgi:hypothetical protein
VHEHCQHGVDRPVPTGRDNLIFSTSHGFLEHLQSIFLLAQQMHLDPGGSCYPRCDAIPSFQRSSTACGRVKKYEHHFSKFVSIQIWLFSGRLLMTATKAA